MHNISASFNLYILYIERRLTVDNVSTASKLSSHSLYEALIGVKSIPFKRYLTHR